MVLKWRWVQVENKRWYNNLIGYSKNNKEHVYMLNEAIKRAQRFDCVRIIIENEDLNK